MDAPKLFIEDDSPIFTFDFFQPAASQVDDEDLNELEKKQKMILQFQNNPHQYNVVNLKGHDRILNHTTPEQIEKLHNGPFYERFPRGYYEDDMEIKEVNFHKVYPMGYFGGPFTNEERRELFEKKEYPPSEPDYNVFYEELYGESLKEMKMIEAFNMRKRNLMYTEANFIIDIVNQDGIMIREHIINRDLEIKEFLKLLFGEGNRYKLDILEVYEINKQISGDYTQWWYIEPVIKKISRNFEKNVYITFYYPDLQKKTRSSQSVVFHGTTKTKDVFDIVMKGNYYKNYFVIKDFTPIISDISSKSDR